MRRRRTQGPRASAGAQTRLAADLRTSLAHTRTAWDAATLRGDAAMRAGDRAAAARALDEQRALLRELHDQVDSVIVRAAVEREAESIVDRVAPPPRRHVAAGRRRAAGAVAGAFVAAVVGLFGVLSDPGPRIPHVAPLAGADAGEVTVASDRVSALDVAFDRIADVLAELRSTSVRAPASTTGPTAAPVTDAQQEGAASDRRSADDGAAPSAPSSPPSPSSDDGFALERDLEGLTEGPFDEHDPDGADDEAEEDAASKLQRLRDRLVGEDGGEGGGGLRGALGDLSWGSAEAR